jgi:hypothetical protein
MAELTSVGIQVRETDLTLSVPPQSASIGAYAGHFNWGPAEEITSIGSEKNLIAIFGSPKKVGDENTCSFLTAESFLKYGNNLRIVRAIGSTARNSKGVVSDGDYNAETVVSNELYKNIQSFESSDKSGENLGALYAKYPGKLGDALKVRIFHSTNTTTGTNDDTFRGIASSQFDFLPDTTDWAGNNEIFDDEIHVIVYDSTGEITGVKDEILETFQGLSLDPAGRTISGSNNYYADVINTSSSYIYVVKTNAIASKIADTYSLFNDEFLFGGGSNGTHSEANVVSALTLYSDEDTVDVNLLFAEKFEGTASNIDEALIEIAENRKDILAFISAPLNLYTLSSDQLKLNAVKANRDIGSSSYVAFDSSPVYTYNKYTDKYTWIPACGHMAGLCAYTDEISEPWFSPAGLNRGQLRNVVKLAFNPIKAHRDDLYKAGVNPIISLPGEGIVLYGDKTGISRPSAFDRINVRRLFNVLKKTCKQASRFQLFELNDDFTRATFINAVEPYLRRVQAGRGITDYRVICDETNNTPDIVDSNQFVANIYIKPARSINYITLNFIATRSAVSFNEISG